MPKKKEDMSYEERKKALRYLMFIKEKRDGTIKAKGCADGRSMQEYTDKVDTSSPTVSLEAMLLTCATDAKERQYVTVTDIPGVFLPADMEQDVHMLLEGTIAELIVKLEPSLYRKFVWKNKHGKPMIYVKLRKHCMGHYRRHFCSGGCCLKPLWNGGSNRMTMTNVSLIKQSTANNVL